MHRRRILAGLSLAVACALLLPATPLVPNRSAQAATLPTGFQETIVFSGLSEPTVVQFAADGRVFVGEKSGLVKVFDNLSDTSPTVFADLRTNVHNFWDRGLLGMALAPDFPTDPYVYVLYAHDAAIGGTAPRWGSVGGTSDGCPTPPGATADGCVISGRVSRLQASGNVMTGPEQVLVEDWCQQYPSHSIGSLAFGADGALYVSGGDGASFNFTDWGQDGSPVNPCGDPPGGALTPPTAEGGALRSQDLRSSGDPTSEDGTVLRIDPATGAPLPNNPLTGPDANARRIVASGLRNPFRFTIRPGTSEVWLGDVGWNTWEEIDRIASPTAGAVNFGWPCYEGDGRQGGYDGANLNLCENLYAQAGAVTAPYYTYNHGGQVVQGEACPTGSSSISGLAFETSSNYPAAYDGALFFADYSRDCIWAMRQGTNGLPDPAQRVTFASAAANPVDLKIGPGGDLFYVDLAGTIRRISFAGANTPPTANIQASPTSGAAPLQVSFDGRGSSDPDPGDGIAAYSWDLNGDGTYGDATSAMTSFTYTDPGTYTARLRVTDRNGATSTPATVTITANNTPPVPVITTPAAGTTWKVGDVISFSGSASDAQDGTSLPASALSWSLTLEHCPSNCHTHPLQTWPDVASGSFSAPDHEYPSYLLLRLTATDSGGLSGSTTLRLDPRTVVLTFTSDPNNAQLTVGSFTGKTTFTRTVIIGSSNTSARRRRSGSGARPMCSAPGRTVAPRPIASSPRPARRPTGPTSSGASADRPTFIGKALGDRCGAEGCPLVLYDCRAMASFEIDPEQSVSIVAILLFIDAAFVGFPLLQDLVLSPGTFQGFALFLFVLVAGLIAGGVGLLKGERWGWYVAIGSAGLLTLLHLAAFSLLALLFDGLILFLLSRPEVRSRFGVR